MNKYNPTPEQIAEVHQAIDLTNRINPILAGHNNEVVGAVLSTLVATWLAGHRLGDERFIDNNEQGIQARIKRLTGLMMEVMAAVPDMMQKMDERMPAKDPPRQS
jgi:hypothetical protein